MQSTPPPAQPPTANATATSWWQRLVGLILVANQPNLPLRPNVHQGWQQTQERVFTTMLRSAALLGSVALILVTPYLWPTPVYGVIIAILAVFWFLGAARRIDFRWRARAFVVLVYVLALVEIANFGFSVESFAYLLTFVVLAVLLTEARGGMVALTLSLVTLTLGAWLIGGRRYVPYITGSTNPVPDSVAAGITSMVAFAACASALVFAVQILLRSVNQAWQMELQAHTLLQRERDLLEQRVTERTQALTQVQSELLQKNNDLRKYFRALEQSGNVVQITDLQGNIEYTNPRFEELTGYTATEVIGKNTRTLKSGKHSPEFYQELWATIQSGKIWRGEFLNRRKNGTLFWEKAVIAPIQNDEGQITNYVAVKEDITHFQRLQALAEEEHARAEALLLNILPEKIAGRLKSRVFIDEVIADFVPATSILFADIVNFTAQTAALSPKQLISVLDQLFTQFDELVHKHGLEKIKTIGDCYMVAAGIPVQCEDHAIKITRLALDMLRILAEPPADQMAADTLLGALRFEMRIGINSGPVVAGVIGRQKFIYDLWGDAVNIASRMEAHGLPGKIQVTEATYLLIKEHFICEPRGLLQIKGKGPMPVWHVLAEKE